MKQTIPFVLFLAGALILACNGSDNDGPDVEEDAIKVECGENIWCYHDKVVELGDENKCPDILNYWNDVDKGVVGSCFNEIARDKSDCSICDRIEKADIHSACVRDVC